MRTRMILTAVSVATGLLSLGAIAAGPTQEPPASRRQVISIDDKYSKISWADERVISSKLPGRIERRPVIEGQIVKAGDLLAELDDREAKLEYEIQKILGESELAILIQRGKLDEYNARRDGADRLIGSGAISREEYRLAYVNVLVNDLLTRQEEEKHEVEQRKSDRAKVIWDDHKIYSPIDGIVQKCFKREQESVAANQPELFRIVAVDRVWIEQLVPEQYLYRVREGQPVQVQLVFRGDQTDPTKVIELPQSKEVFEGKITFIDPDVDAANRSFRVRAEVQNRLDEKNRPLLRAGLHTSMKIFLDEP